MKYKIGDIILYEFTQSNIKHVEFIAKIMKITQDIIVVDDIYSSSGESIADGFEITLNENRYSDSKVIKNFGKLTLEEIKEQFPEYFV